MYILRCQGNRLYSGITNSLGRRMRAHCGLAKGGAKFTRSYPPEEIMGVWQTEKHAVALRFEIQCKKLSHGQKQQLIAYPEEWAVWMPNLTEEKIVSADFSPLAHYLQEKKPLEF